MPLPHKSLFPPAPAGTRRTPLASERVRYDLPAAAVGRGSVAGWRFPGLERWCALHLRSIFWSGPAWGTNPAAIPPDTQCLLWQRRDGTCGAFLPLVSGNLCATLQPSPKGPVLQLAGAAPGDNPIARPGAVAALGASPAAALQAALEAAREVLGTFRLREEKPRPAFLDWFGWCTWDAFYHSVSQAGVRQGLSTFQKGGTVPGFVIIDDGWLDTEGDHLKDFPARADKFPGGLSALAATARKTGVRLFGVWHAFQGYWAGPHPKGPLSRRYQLHVQPGNIRPWNPEETRDLSRIHDSDIARFYQDFHRYLRDQGVDLVKVDGQSALQRFCEGSAGRGETMGRWQEALQGAAAVHFRGNLLHCMCNGNDVAYHLLNSNAWRNSDDYFPRRGPDQQQLHLVLNAYNALWSGGFSWPDWDMFQSHGPAADFHAVARSISGGPVYVSDHPGKQDFALLRRLALPTGAVPTWDRPATVTNDLVFTNVLEEPVALKIHNYRGPLGVLGCFHCWTGHDDRPVAARWRPADVPELPRSGAFLAYQPATGEVREVSSRKVQRDTLPPLGWSLWVLAPIGPAAAVPLGLADLWSGAAALDAIVHEAEDELAFRLRHPGRALFWSRRTPSTIRVDGRSVRPKPLGSGLYSVLCDKAERPLVRIRFATKSGRKRR
ncbi:MAG: hypothetical protein EA425_10560 [Puniceicoccaceae bacterium]|nr:MAG: hypothetical protein EA425_10560 [Puniceicoccaceae bacterium]